MIDPASPLTIPTAHRLVDAKRLAWDESGLPVLVKAIDEVPVQAPSETSRYQWRLVLLTEADDSN